MFALLLACSPVPPVLTQRVHYGSAVVTPGVNGTSSIAADFDGDGRLDLAETARVQGETIVRVLLADGSGSHRVGLHHEFETGTVPAECQLAAGDLDRDGDVDFVVVDNRSLYRFFNDGAGGYELFTELVWWLGVYPTAAALVDLGGDGAPELVVQRAPETIDVLENDGSGSLSVAETFYAACFDATDVDGDTSPELVLGYGAQCRVRIIDWRAPGTWTELAALATERPVHRITVAELGGGPGPDLAIVSESATPKLSVLLQAGPLQFVPTSTESVGNTPFRPVAADLDADGAVDLVVPLRDEGRLRVAFGRGDGTFEPPLFLPVGRWPRHVTAYDYDADGRIDLHVGQASGGSFQLVRNLGGRRFDARAADRFPVNLPQFHSAIGDLDGDGLPELVHTEGSAGTVRVLRNEGARSFGPGQSYAALQVTSRVWLVDLDGDGALDAVAGGVGVAALAVLYGRGDGTLEPAVLLRTPRAAQLASFGDFDSNGLLDIAVVGYHASTSPPDTEVLVQRTRRNLVPYALLPGLSTVYAMGTAEVTGDAHADLVFVDGSTQNRIQVLAGQGDGSFLMGPSVQAPGWLYPDLVVHDFDEDGDEDVLTNVQLVLQSLSNLGDGALAWAPLLRTPLPGRLALGDLRGDGRIDIVLSGDGDSAFALQNLGGGAYQPAAWIAFAESTPRVYLADLDGDGLGDFVGEGREALLVRYADL